MIGVQLQKASFLALQNACFRYRTPVGCLKRPSLLKLPTQKFAEKFKLRDQVRLKIHLCSNSQTINPLNNGTSLEESPTPLIRKFNCLRRIYLNPSLGDEMKVRQRKDLKFNGLSICKIFTLHRFL